MWRVGKWIVGGLALAVAVTASVVTLKQLAQRDARIAELDRAVDSLSQQVAAVDTVYQVAVDTLWRVRQVTDHRLDTLRLRDTLIHRDTVYQLVEAERQACDAVIRSCEQRVAARDSLIAAQAVQIEVLRPRPSSLLGLLPLPSREVAFGLGLLTGWALTK